MTTPQNSAVRSAQSGPFTLKAKTISVNIPSMATLTTADVAITFAGCKVGDVVSVEPLTALEAGILAGQATVLADGTVTWRVANVTAGTIDPAALNCRVAVSSQH
jgi:hypothetical protein